MQKINIPPSKRKLNNQIKNIKKSYPLFNEKQYVLWILAENTYDYKTFKIKEKISLKKKNGEIIKLNTIVRNPYPNKYLNQISFKCENETLNGIPLVFNTFEELCQIEEVEIKWILYNIDFNGEKSTISINEVDVKYFVTFNLDKDKNKRFYTIYSCDSPQRILGTGRPFIDIINEISNDKHYHNYLQEFDKAFASYGEFKINSYDELNENNELLMYMIFFYMDRKNGTDVTSIDMSIPYINKRTFLDKNFIDNMIKIVDIKDYFVWYKFYQEKSEILLARECADLIIDNI